MNLLTYLFIDEQRILRMRVLGQLPDGPWGVRPARPGLRGRVQLTSGKRVLGEQIPWAILSQFTK